MRDFAKLVAPQRKRNPREREIVSELACHLEELYIDLLNSGTSEEDAFAAVSAAGKSLGPTVRRLKWQRDDGLRAFLRAVLLPGVVLAMVYEGCSAAWIVYWDRASFWIAGSMALITVALGFCASSFSRELGGTVAHRVGAAAAVISVKAVTVCTIVYLFTPIEVFQNTQYNEPVGVAVSRLFWILLWNIVTPVLEVVLGGLLSVYAFPAGARPQPLRGDAA